jgi:hypothetical protein
VLRQVKDGAGLGGVAKTFDRYVFTLQGTCRALAGHLQGLAGRCVWCSAELLVLYDHVVRGDDE